MAREFGPTRFEALSQGSSARAAMVEAARASLADDVLAPEVSHSRRRPRAVPVFAVAGVLGIAAIACGGAKGTSNHEFTPTPNNPEPTATRMSEILPTTQAPTQTAQIEATATEEQVVTAHDITVRIQEIQSLIQTDIPLVDDAQGLESAVNLDDPRDAQGTLNGYGRMAKAIGDNICNLGVKQQNVIETWLMIKTFFRDYGMRLESLERLPSGGTTVLLSRYFNNPGCAVLEGQ